MPANTQLTAALVQVGEVPPDQNCLTDVNALLPVVAAYMAVAVQDPANPASQTDSTAAQALEAANNALAQVSALQALIPQRRTSGTTLIPLPTGDSTVPISWAPDMPSTVYSVQVTIFGAAAHPAAYYGWRVVETSRTVNSLQLSFDNIPANSSFSYIVEST